MKHFLWMILCDADGKMCCSWAIKKKSPHIGRAFENQMLLNTQFEHVWLEQCLRPSIKHVFLKKVIHTLSHTALRIVVNIKCTSGWNPVQCPGFLQHVHDILKSWSIHYFNILYFFLHVFIHMCHGKGYSNTQAVLCVPVVTALCLSDCTVHVSFLSPFCFTCVTVCSWFWFRVTGHDHWLCTAVVEPV